MPFRHIVEDFLQEEKLDMLSLEIIPNSNGIGSKLADESIARKFDEFHREKSILRYLCFTCNVTAKRREIDQQRK